MDKEFRNLGFLKTYGYPSLFMFLVPAFSWWFFSHAQSTFDRNALSSIESGIQQDATLSAEERERALEFFRNVPVSRILASSAPELDDFKKGISDQARFHYATFRWMIRLAVVSVLAGIGFFVFMGISVLLALRSQRIQYVSLAVGWQVLRVFATYQVVAQACMLLALSFWITALWFNVYVPKLIFVVGFVGIASVVPVLAAIFKRIDDKFDVSGEVISRESAAELWGDLARLGTAVGAKLPDQIVAGVDDNFFVTEHPVMVNGVRYTGRTLYISLSLLKVLQGTEADAVLAHELAHFSGQDTLYSKKISPLLQRYQLYLEGLYNGVLSRPVYYCAFLFRALYQISLGKHSREREFRADRIAAETTSGRDVASALLRIAAYSRYRQDVVQKLFDAEKAHSRANISGQIEEGFPAFASAFATTQDFSELTTSHPFDTHPPLTQRLESLGFDVKPEAMNAVLCQVPDGAWFWRITGAESLEQSQWSQYEEQFREFHENVLAFRYLPETDEERTLVEQYFPAVNVEANKGNTAVFDCEKISFNSWDTPVFYRDIKSATAETEWGKPLLRLSLKDGSQRDLPLSSKESVQKELFGVFERYSGRYAAAVAYRENKATEVAESAAS